MTTNEPGVVIEEMRPGYVRYRRLETGERWEVHGTCDMRGDCLIGSACAYPRDPSRETLVGSPGGRPDVVVGPNYRGECCPLRVVRL